MTDIAPVGQDLGNAYQAARAVAPEEAALDSLMKRTGGTKSDESNPVAPATAPQETPAPSQHGIAYRTGKDILKGTMVESPRAIYTGARDAVKNTYDSIDSFGDWGEKAIGKATGVYGVVFDKHGVHMMSPEEAGVPTVKGQITGEKPVPRAGDAAKDFVDTKMDLGTLTGQGRIEDPKTVTGELIKGVSQFLTGLALTRGAFKAVGLPAEVSGAGGYAYSALKGAVANFAAFDPHQQRLSNLVEKFPALSNPVTQYLQSKPGDSDAEGRFKNSLEGLGLGVLTDGFFKGVRMLRGMADAKAQTAGIGDIPESEAPGVGDNAFRELGDTSPQAPLVSDKPFSGPPAPEAPVGGRTPLGNALRASEAEMKTAGVTPEEIAGAVKPEKPQTFINFARIDTPEDIQAVTQQLADRFKGSVDSATRGTQSFEQIKLNSQMENAWNILSNRRLGEPLNAEQSVAARELWASSADKLKQLATEAVTSPTEANLFAFRKMMATHYAIQQEVIGARTETARALASWRIPVGSSASRLQDITDRMMELSGGMDNIKNMARFVSERAELNQPHELEKFIEKSAYARTRDAVIQAFSDGLLSSPVTQAKILASNVTTGLWRIGERGLAARFSQAIGTPDGVQPGEASAMWSGWIGSFKDAMAYGWKAAKTGTTGEGIGEPHEAHPSNISAEALNLSDKPWLGRAADYIGQALSLGRRGIAAQHDVALTMAYRGELNAQAVRQATQELNAGELTEKAFGGRVAELLDDSSVQAAARQGARYQAFLDEPGKLTQWILEGRREIPALRVIAPFIKIPSRIMSYTFERTPLAPLMSEFRSKIAAGGATRDLALTQVALGTFISAAAADMTLSGTLKGGGPPQKGIEQAQEREGMMRDSLKVGNRWYNINGVHPVGKLMLLAADVAEALNYGQPELHQDADTEKLAVGTTLAIARTLTDSSYFTGFANLFATLHDARVGGAGEGALLSTAGSTVPALVSAIDRAGDPYQREVYSMLDEFKSKIPGLSNSLPPRRNLWGEPIPSGHDPITNLISPVKMADEKHEPIDDEILKQGFNITMPERMQTFADGKTHVPVDMSKYPAAYSRLLELSGNELKHPAWNMGLKDLLNAVVSGNHALSSIYRLKSDGPEGGKEVMIRDLISQYRDLAKRQVLDEYPAIAQEVADKADNKRALKLGVTVQ